MTDAPASPSIALSIRQPWAHLVIHEGKSIENRSWSTRYRGPLLIHAAKAMTDDEFRLAMACVDDWFPLDREAMLCRRARASNARRGGIIGVVDLVDVVTEHSSRWFNGAYGWVLANPRPLPFRPYRGRLGLFEVAP